MFGGVGRIGRYPLASVKGGGAPPPGFVWVRNANGGYVRNAQGGRIYARAPQ